MLPFFFFKTPGSWSWYQQAASDDPKSYQIIGAPTLRVIIVRVWWNFRDLTSMKLIESFPVSKYRKIEFGPSRCCSEIPEMCWYRTRTSSAFLITAIAQYRYGVRRFLKLRKEFFVLETLNMSYVSGRNHRIFSLELHSCLYIYFGNWKRSYL